jgi:hypothetical protein
MKKYKMKNNGTTGINPICQWMYSDNAICGRVDYKGGALINEKFFCSTHLVNFEVVDRQFKILEEIEVEI